MPANNQLHANGIFENYHRRKNMQRHSENQIRSLHAEFRSLKKYGDKLAFYDRIFGIIPFSFPEFDPLLDFFFQKEKTSELTAIYKMERNNPHLTEKKFSFEETFVFNIRPANSNSAAYSSFILSRFLSRAPEFEEWVQEKKSTGITVESLLDEANGVVNKIEWLLQNEYDKSFTLQCMAIFYKGVYDTLRKQVALPGKKRKFIELFLYAQGIIYAHYIRFLKTDLYRPYNPVDLPEPVFLDFSGKLALLEELGILDFLKKKYSRLDPVSFEKKIAEFIRLITGDGTDQKEILLSIKKVISSTNENEKRIAPQIVKLFV
jgi:hypothetical protein